MVLSRTDSPTIHRLPATPDADGREPALPAALRTHGILQSYLGLSSADAYSFISVATDFTVKEVVDQRQGVPGRIDKRCFPRWIGISA